jgi:phytoene synthase
MPITLEGSYARCREVARRHGTTYYASTVLLPRAKRPHVWALYAFCRTADDIVDDDPDSPVEAKAEALAMYGARFARALDEGESHDPILMGVVHTVRQLGLDRDLFTRFLHSMAMDLTVDRYETWEDLLVYMDGSAAVIGEMMLPVLEPTGGGAVGPARDLGVAFQLTNFLRDVDEDLDRGRVYIPQEDLRAFGADPHRRRVDEPWHRLMRFEVERCRELYRSADEGIGLLPPASARCVRAARVLYAQILDQIEAAGDDVFTARARVPTRTKVATVARLSMPSARRRRPARPAGR